MLAPPIATGVPNAIGVAATVHELITLTDTGIVLVAVAARAGVEATAATAASPRMMLRMVVLSPKVSARRRASPCIRIG